MWEEGEGKKIKIKNTTWFFTQSFYFLKVKYGVEEMVFYESENTKRDMDGRRGRVKRLK